ncbi:carbohydrate ABC transporter permease [Paenibacillus sp. UMB7766-LJ446]|uniref:carbohydrate ABC transporter permease n=1 Tax=Paenibacillus sp. UMB7766-LJ446 TaxID=3046313 RepID=UPI00254AB2D1|nr:carbohydrate ABC transporter permease [Paenibacillus sp. UMB7766-LJ446]MDK8189904.1 carbohydrate ABC transporter permease [Paenibacillus sp. UMB7766-LJ446]
MSTYLRPTLGSRIFDACNIVFLLIFGFLMVYPFINLLAISLNDGNDAVRGGIYLFPRKFSLSAYQLLFQNDSMLRGLKWSVLRVIAGTTTCLFATGLLAYIVTIRHFSGRKYIRLIFFYTMYLSGGLIPTYLLIMNLGLGNSFLVYVLPNLFNVYFMLLMASYIQNLPEAMLESARMDGASEFMIYCRIIIPVAVPVFAAVSIYLAVNHWNAWFDVILYNSDGNYDTIQVYLRRLLLEVESLRQINDQQVLYNKYQDLTPVTLRAATTMVVVLPILMVYPFFQKYFVGGLTIGSVKG